MTHYEKIDTMLTTGEVAQLFGVNPSTVRWWSRQHKIKAYRIGLRGDRRFRRDEIAAFFLERAVRKYLRNR